MSVVVALRGRDGVVVAADSRRHEQDGTYIDVCNKTFRLGRGAVGAAIGLLDIGGQPVPEILKATLPLTPTMTLSEVVKKAGVALGSRLNASRHTEAVEVVFAGSKVLDGQAPAEIHSLRLAREDGAPYAAVARSWNTPCAAGDDDAKAFVVARLNRQLSAIARMDRDVLVSFASQVVEQAIRKAGPHPHFPNRCSCGGAAKLVYESIGPQRSRR